MAPGDDQCEKREADTSQAIMMDSFCKRVTPKPLYVHVNVCVCVCVVCIYSCVYGENNETKQPVAHGSEHGPLVGVCCGSGGPSVIKTVHVKGHLHPCICTRGRHHGLVTRGPTGVSRHGEIQGDLRFPL